MRFQVQVFALCAFAARAPAHGFVLQHKMIAGAAFYCFPARTTPTQNDCALSQHPAGFNASEWGTRAHRGGGCAWSQGMHFTRPGFCPRLVRRKSRCSLKVRFYRCKFVCPLSAGTHAGDGLDHRIMYRCWMCTYSDCRAHPRKGSPPLWLAFTPHMQLCAIVCNCVQMCAIVCNILLPAPFLELSFCQPLEKCSSLACSSQTAGQGARFIVFGNLSPGNRKRTIPQKGLAKGHCIHMQTLSPEIKVEIVVTS